MSDILTLNINGLKLFFKSTISKDLFALLNSIFEYAWTFTL